MTIKHFVDFSSVIGELLKNYKNNIFLNLTRFRCIWYRVTHKGWDFRDDSTDFIMSVSLNSGFPAAGNLILSFPNMTTLISH